MKKSVALWVFVMILTGCKNFNINLEKAINQEIINQSQLLIEKQNLKNEAQTQIMPQQIRFNYSFLENPTNEQKEFLEINTFSQKDTINIHPCINENPIEISIKTICLYSDSELIKSVTQNEILDFKSLLEEQFYFLEINFELEGLIQVAKFKIKICR